MAALLLAILTACVAMGCNRKPQLVPADADSTGVVDSSEVLLREVQSLWEGAASEEAAELTARALRERIAGRPPAEWKERADFLLDSLGVGYESAAGDCGLLVNLFSRSDPGAGSWPWLFTCDGEAPRWQQVEGKNLRLTHLVTRGLAPPGQAMNGVPGVAALFGRRAGAGQQPVLMVWTSKTPRGPWENAQTLGPDSLGGTGTGEFESPADTTIELVTRTYRTPSGFSECATCPHLYKIHRFRWGPKSFVRATRDSLVPSPYAAFVELVQALAANDRDRALLMVSEESLYEQARRLDWGGRRGSWRVAPGAGETPSQMVFFRGDQEAYRVFFTRRGGDWVINGFEETTRSLE